jgi:N-acetylglucosamine-6-phosphate deacetylase
VATIDAARVLTPDGFVGPVRVYLDGGHIGHLEPISATASVRTLVPGFVDLQVNGVDDVDVASARGSDWERLDSLLLAQGVTTWCPTLVTMPLPKYDAPLARIAEAMNRPTVGRPTIAGAHLEGPFLGRSPGAHPPHLITAPDMGWLARLPAQVAMMTIAPEQPGAIDAIRMLTESGRLVSIGHTQCSEHEFDAAVAAGARLTTHLFNGMSGVHHRSPGVAVFALTDQRVSASLIADLVHVHPRVLALAAGSLGSNRTVLVTDAVAWRAGTAGSIGIEFADGAPRLPDGTLAGSSLTMISAVQNLVDCGVPLEHVLMAASTNPARLLGLRHVGTLAPGMRADLVALSPALEVEQVWVAGSACLR